MSGNGYEEIEMLRKRNQMLTQEINQLRQSLLNGGISSENKEKNYQEEQDVSSHFESALKHELEGVKTNLTQTKVNQESSSLRRAFSRNQDCVNYFNSLIKYEKVKFVIKNSFLIFDFVRF